MHTKSPPRIATQTTAKPVSLPLLTWLRIISRPRRMKRVSQTEQRHMSQPAMKARFSRLLRTFDRAKDLLQFGQQAEKEPVTATAYQSSFCMTVRKTTDGGTPAA